MSKSNWEEEFRKIWYIELFPSGGEKEVNEFNLLADFIRQLLADQIKEDRCCPHCKCANCMMNRAVG